MMRYFRAAAVFAICLLAGVASVAQTQPRLTPILLTGVNTPKDEDEPHLAAKGLRLYYASNATGRWRILVSKRSTVMAPWPAGVAVQGPDDETDSRGPCLSADDHDLYFATRFVVRDPGKKKAESLSFDIAHAIKLDRTDQFTSPTAVQSVCTEAEELYPWITANGQELYHSRKTKEGWRLFVAGRPKGKGAFGEPELVKEVPVEFQHAALTRDGRVMYLHGPLENGRWGLFRASRAGPQAPWTAPESLDDLNSPETPPRRRHVPVAEPGRYEAVFLLGPAGR